MANRRDKRAAAKKPEGVAVGKGKVTPVQVAFIVDRYLADNNYANALAAFRSEAADLFSKTKVKEVPRGLLGLGEMLDEYITLKEQKVMLDQEKRRVETALQGMQEVLQNYFSPTGSASLPPSPPQFVAGPAPMTMAPVPILPTSYPNSGSPPVQNVKGISIMKYPQPSPITLPSNSAGYNTFSTPGLESSSSKKRKSLQAAVNASSAPKKSTRQPSFESSKDVESCSQVVVTKEAEKIIDIPLLEPTASDHRATTSPAQGTSVTTSLFKQSPDYHTKCSPKTPPQAEESASPTEINDDGSLKEIASANCSIITSETIVISPLKHTNYYAVERSYHIASPYKPCSKRKREQVRGKLDFDKPDALARREEPVTAGSSTSNSEEWMESFDFDLPDLDIFDGDFSLSAFLEDIDLECGPSHPPSALASTSGCEHNFGDQCRETNELPVSSQSVLEVHSQDMKIQVSRGPDSVTSMKTMTKRIKFASPVKSSSKEQKSLQVKA